MRERGRKRDSGGGTGRERSKCSKILRGYPLGHLNKGYPGILCTFLLFHKSESPLKFTILKILTGMNRVWLPFFCGALGRLLPWGMRTREGSLCWPPGHQGTEAAGKSVPQSCPGPPPRPKKGQLPPLQRPSCSNQNASGDCISKRGWRRLFGASVWPGDLSGLPKPCLQTWVTGGLRCERLLMTLSSLEAMAN